ncbi:DNA starvation/stationary phase protection protein Dps [Leptolyngbya cf. ectocarpi LEGE 11479]|uniref:DNA starvation/stationary phase protection protein Dps n=1 Tax=Leptolyngbya cf. ectocarpi LEGE 11479 TaxID=1828722 RepID=A0A928ZR03_LEPEC|nr:DNA starvation/stationary phase protection protein Dps [Leptolyngbya ectocarpi]MBE9066805.1 DNA starvation/stationary phase protection protein Dps [Leptolyngbya cf. ectocarpi LEGE 11479]
MNNHLHIDNSDEDSQLFKKVRVYPTHHDLPEDIRVQVTELLNQTLFTTLDLKSQVKQAHWNVKGMNFHQLHNLFDEIAAPLETYIDMVAERITSLGSTAMGTVRIAARYSELPEYNLDSVNGKEHLATLAERLAIYAKLLRTAIEQTADLGDADTSDLYTEISRTIDKSLWLLDSHLQAN